MDSEADLLARARELSDRLLYPNAHGVDRADRVPDEHFDRLAEAGLYGIGTRPDDRGLRFPGALVETLASGCLATTFVWLQHHAPVRAAATSPQPGVRERWLPALASGQRRAGTALAGVRGARPLRVRPVPGGYLLDGVAPWVTGWEMIDTLYLAARDDADVIHFLFLDAAPAATITVERHELMAATASRTATLEFHEHVVEADRLAHLLPYEDFARGDASGSALNGFLALGVANRCARLLAQLSSVDTSRPVESGASRPVEPGASRPVEFGAELEECRVALVGADSRTTPAARAAASALALRAAAQLAVSTGSRAVLQDGPAPRLLREAGFLLVFGSRPSIRDELLARLRAS